jgi:hypothetical protein
MQPEEDPTKINFSAKEVAKYALLPGIFPRLQRMADHFAQFLYMFTQIFGSVGLIDKNHPCLRPENIGRYRFGDIIGLAASNVVFDRKHLPQTIMFFVVILSIVLTVAIVLGMIASTIFAVHSAHAQFFSTPKGFTPSGGGTAVTYAAGSDWALNFLYRIFGDTGFWPHPADGSSIGNPWYTAILLGMLKYYSLAMLVVAAFMILYILVITLTESARTGEPFGQRFDGIWAPVRLALAIGMLMPIASGGYNGAQLLTFQVAVWGSNLATNVWYGGLQSMSGSSKGFFGSSMTDPGYRFIRDVFLVNLCVDAVSKQGKKSWNAGDMQYSWIMSKDSMTYSFGTTDAPDFCGQVTFLKTTQGALASVSSTMGQIVGQGKTVYVPPGPASGVNWPEQTIQAYLKIAAKFLPIGTDALKTGLASDGSLVHTGTAAVQGDMQAAVDYATEHIFGDDSAANTKYFGQIMTGGNFGAADIKKWVLFYWQQLGVNNIDDTAHTHGAFFSTTDWQSAPGDKCRTNVPMDCTNVIDQYNKWVIDSITGDAGHGWTSAGVFYLRISTALATISKVVGSPPRVSKMPYNLVKAYATPDNPSANTSDKEGSGCGFWAGVLHGFTLGMAGNSVATCEKYALAKEINGVLEGGKSWFLDAVHKDPPTWTLLDGQNFDRALELSESGSATNMEASGILGPVLDALSDMTKIDSTNLNPLGVVVTWGNVLMSVAMLSYTIGLIGLGEGWVDMAFMVGHTLMLPGFILAFWVPTLPFMHFTFAVIEWMISVLEAIIGMPLWALSLITLEGDGLGAVGMKGVKRLFELFLRPTIIILALIASVIIFTAGVSFFNDALALYGSAQAQSNADQSGFQATVGGFGMIFLYMFAIYSLATSCFKLIDSIPDRFGRWFGLEGGFGSNIKTGMSSLQDLIVGATAFQSMKNITGGAQGTSKANKDRKAEERLAESKKRGG